MGEVRDTALVILDRLWKMRIRWLIELLN